MLNLDTWLPTRRLMIGLEYIKDGGLHAVNTMIHTRRITK